jgi:hypothetical protein
MSACFYDIAAIAVKIDFPDSGFHIKRQWQFRDCCKMARDPIHLSPVFIEWLPPERT